MWLEIVKIIIKDTFIGYVISTILSSETYN